MDTARHIFVGDVQGCREELEELLETLRFDPAADALHPVGDLVNRGPDSAGCLRVLRAAGAGGVVGNHDLALLAAAAGERAPGERDTFGDVLAADDREELLDWLAARPFARLVGDVATVHAGFSPAWTDPLARLADQDPRAPGDDGWYAVTVRYCDVDGRLPDRKLSAPEPPFLPWHERFDRRAVGGRTVVFGHWATQGLLLKEGFRGLDSGCVWGGALSAWIAEEDRVVQVPARRAHAPVR